MELEVAGCRKSSGGDEDERRKARMASIKIDPKQEPLRSVLPILLTDRTTKKNIIFASESYLNLGPDFRATSPITENRLLLDDGECFIQPRFLKRGAEQAARTRKSGEVFTPVWVCCLMNNYCDEVWFGRPDLFNTMDGQEWKSTEARVGFPKDKTWNDYIDSRRLEITCGEAPFVVSRYDVGTGTLIPIEERIGILDRKLRILNENELMKDEWLAWALRAFQSVYGYEYQGDNLLVARINLLLTFTEYLHDRWRCAPSEKELTAIAKVISWNFWQMDGLTGTIPMGALDGPNQQGFLTFDEEPEEDKPEKHPPCLIYDWRAKKAVEFLSLKKEEALL